MVDYEEMTQAQAQAELEEIGRELADANRRRGLNTIMYELGLIHERLIELGVEL